jgi:hypothetical protein
LVTRLRVFTKSGSDSRFFPLIPISGSHAVAK